MIKESLAFLLLFPCLLGVNETKPLEKERSSDDSNFTNLIIFAKFQDEDEFIFSDDSNGVKNIVHNSYDVSRYSLNEYVRSISNNHIRMKNLFLFDNGGSITLSEKRGHYARKSDTNPDGYTSNSQNMRSMLEIDWSEKIQALLDKKEKLVDFEGNEYPYFSLDLQKDYESPYVGNIDNITLIFKRSDNADLDIRYGDPLYTYQSTNNRISYSLRKNYSLQSYNYVQSFTDYKTTYVGDDNVEIFALGNLGHETTHSLGLLDLYSQYTNDSGVGRFSSMGRRATYVPQFVTAKERDKMGWLSSSNVKQIKKNGTYHISLTKDTIGAETVAYKILDEDDDKEYYLEYRRFDTGLNRFDNFKASFSGNLAYSGRMDNGLAISMHKKNQPLSNLTVKNRDWNYQILGGNNADKSDAALNLSNPDMEIADLTYAKIHVQEMNDTEIVFNVSSLPEAYVSSIQFKNVPESLSPGDSYLLETILEGGNLSFAETTYSLRGNSSSKTQIDQNGRITIGEDETSKEIEVIAESEGKKVSCSISILSNTCVHSLIYHERVEPTCFETGMKEYYECSKCHKLFLNKDATEETDLESLLLAKLEHQPITIPGKEPTCEEDGYSSSVECRLCHSILTPSTKIDKLGHNPSSWIVDEEPTYSQKGHKHIECLRCEKILQEEDIPVLTPSSSEEKPSSSEENSSSIGNVSSSVQENSSSESNGNSTSSSSNENNSQNNGDFAIGIGVTSTIIGLGIVGGLLYFLLKRRKRQS